MRYPHYQAIPYQNPLVIFHHFASQKGAIFLDSAEPREGCGRYSFIGVDPFFILQCQQTETDPFQILEKYLEQYPLENHPDLPPFQGGVAGYFSYDLCHYLEKIPVMISDMPIPDLLLGFYDLIIAFDQIEKRAWIFSSGYPEKDLSQRAQRAQDRCSWLQQALGKIAPLPPINTVTLDEQFLHANFTQAEYVCAVTKVMRAIRAGDIFEANISQRFKAIMPTGLTAFDLYRRLRCINPAPFSAFLNFDSIAIASASPERFLKLSEGNVETRPIKGTRPRGKTPEEDQQFALDLAESEKDHAENVMIVDLLRNDLSRVCENFSVNVPQLCHLESYATVHHLVSVIHGTLRKNQTAIDLLRATFPGGSITGAPKIRAMEIIAEIEPTARGIYCGCIGYIGFNGDLDTSITIRTYAIQKNSVTFQVGGAVTLDSDPLAEYHETLTKAAALKKAFTQIDYLKNET